MKESVVERYLVKRVRELGGECRKVVFPGHRGAPDRLAMFRSSLFWIELKSSVGKLSPLQQREHARFKRMGQTVLVFSSKFAIDQWADKIESGR